MPGSPCIDAGTNPPPNGLPLTDIDGNPRILDGDGNGSVIADMGAYEYNPQKPSIAISETGFSCDVISDPCVLTLQIRNCGGGTLNWQIVEDCNWLSVTPATGASAGEIDEVTLTIVPNGLKPGPYNCSLTVLDPEAVNTPRTVEIELHVFAEVICVPRDVPTIQCAIDHVLEGGQVIVADGSYKGKGNYDINFNGKAITVKSENGPKRCIIECQYTGSGFLFGSGEEADSVLSGLTITHCYGPGILLRDSSPTITNCIIMNCFGYDGGGISCRVGSSQSSPTITDCIITNCYAYDGGGIYCYGGSPTIANCIISDNVADWSGGGGGIFCQFSSPTIKNCIITGNLGYPDGGGGIYCIGSEFMMVKPKIIDCVITGNSAVFGGGIYVRDCSSAIISNCTIVGNLSTRLGGALRLAQNESVQVTNCILWNNLPDQINEIQNTSSVAYSDVQGGWPGLDNINIIPQFVNAGSWNSNGTPNDPNDDLWVEGNYHLLGSSPCINGGDPNYVAEPDETDLDGRSRVIGGRIDMGAYEYWPPLEAEMKFTPQTLNCKSSGKWVKAHILLPEGLLVEDIDVDSPAVAGPMGTESQTMKVFENDQGRTVVECDFDRSAFCQALTSSGSLDVTVTGLLRNGREFVGSDTVKIIAPGRR
jgi:hypothetical protein